MYTAKYAQNGSKMRFFEIFQKTVHQIFFILCTIIEANEFYDLTYVVVHRKFWFGPRARPNTPKMNKIMFFAYFSNTVPQILFIFCKIIHGIVFCNLTYVAGHQKILCTPRARPKMLKMCKNQVFRYFLKNYSLYFFYFVHNYRGK